MRGTIDLNADLGESFGRWRLGDDEAMMPIITSANVACGFHAGDPSTLRRACDAAVAHGVVIGAQVSYPDLVGFGRRFVDMAAGELVDAVLYQIGALDGLARVAGSRVAYVKPHGALYNAIVHHDAQAAAVAEAVVTYDASLPVLGLPGSAIERACRERRVPFAVEGFADRAYTDDGRLVPRSEPGAVHADVDAIADQAVRLAAVPVSSICVHGDSPHALAAAAAVRRALTAAGWTLRPFVER